MQTAKDLVSDTIQLISLPDAYLRLKSVLDSPNSSMADVAQVISQDPSLTARLLKMVNSPFYGFASKIDTISRAINMLGTQQVHDLTLATTIVNSFSGFTNDKLSIYDFWMNSVYCASSARLLAFYCDGIDTERPFVGGLLHEIGHLVMYQQIPDETREAEALADEKQILLYQAEREVLGFDYAEVGAELMANLELPESLKQVTQYHVEPDKAKKEFKLETTIVHIASRITDAATRDIPVTEELEVHPQSWEITGLNPEVLPRVKEEADQQWQMSMDLIFTKKPGS